MNLKRMAAEIKETVVNANLAHTQKLCPETGQCLLNLGFRRSIIPFQLGAVEFLRFGCFGKCCACLFDKRIHIQRRHDDLCLVLMQGPKERISTLFRQDPLRQVVLQPFFSSLQ